MTQATPPAPFFRVVFSRMDSDQIKNVTLFTLDHVQSHADVLGREGWILKEVNPTQHAAVVKYFGQTHFEWSNNLSAKNGWAFSCVCGDEDYTYDKQGIIEIAKDHTANVIVHHKNGNVKVLA